MLPITVERAKEDIDFLIELSEIGLLFEKPIDNLLIIIEYLLMVRLPKIEKGEVILNQVYLINGKIEER